MKRNVIVILIIIGIFVLGYLHFFKEVELPITQEPAVNPESVIYTIDDTPFHLSRGRSELEDGTSLALFGNPVYGDLDADGDTDAAVLLVYNGGGSGTFFYAALAINTNGTYTSRNTLFIGDRIAPQTIKIHDGRAVYNYAERGSDEPMTASPSISKSLWVHLDPNTGEISEWVKDFEGESAL
jgi:hypothetical protein